MGSCKFVNELNRLRKSSSDSIDNVESFDPFKVYMHVTRTAEEDLKNIENTLVELEEKFDTDLRVEKDFAFHQAIAQGGHNPVISSLLLIITPDILKYYQKYKVCAVPQKTVHAEHREMLQKIKDRDKEGMKELVLRHLANLIDFAKMSAKGDIPEFEYGHI